MGSFTDIVICRENRHTVTELQEPWANALLLWLQALCFFLAKQPQRSFAAERLFNAVGKLDAPLSAFEGGDRADASCRGSAEKPRLSGWRCRLCGYAQVSYRNTEAFIADDVLPDMIFHACEKLTLDLLVDRVLADEPADITGRREQMATALASSNISLHDCAGWMRPCPSCGSNETEVYYWRWATSREARFTPDY
jgi:hypothetical protein